MADTARTTPTAEVRPIPTGSAPGEISPVVAVGVFYPDQKPPTGTKTLHPSKLFMASSEADIIEQCDLLMHRSRAAERVASIWQKLNEQGGPGEKRFWTIMPRMARRTRRSMRRVAGLRSPSWRALAAKADALIELRAVRWGEDQAFDALAVSIASDVSRLLVAASIRSDDAELPGLIANYDRKRAENVTAGEALTAPRMAYFAAVPPIPPALIWRWGDTFRHPTGRQQIEGSTSWYSVYSGADIDRLRKMSAPVEKRLETQPAPWNPDEQVGRYVPHPDVRAIARRDELISTFDAWEAEKREVLESTGLAAAEDKADAAMFAENDAEDMVLDYVPRTFAGLQAKARWVQRTNLCADGALIILRDICHMPGAAQIDNAARLKPPPITEGQDAIIAMHRKASELYAYHGNDEISGDEAEAALDQMNALVLAAPAVPPSTPAGALAALTWGREELLRMMEQRGANTPWDKAIVSMLDGALAVFRGVFPGRHADPRLATPLTGDLSVLKAVADLHRLDNLQIALCARYNRDTDKIPGYAETEVAWDAALRGVVDSRAASWAGLVAKASVLKAESVWQDHFRTDEVANSLAEDLLRMAGRAWDPKTSRDAVDSPKRKLDGAARPTEERAA